MSIVAPIDFKGQALIAQIENSDVYDNVQYFIDVYEPKFLKELLGLDLFTEFEAGLAEETIDTKWISLRDETDLKQMIVYYVYWFIQENDITTTVGTGESKLRKDNAQAANPLQKMVRNWNDMVEDVRLFDLDTETYPNWHRVYWRNWFCGCNWRLPEIYQFKNQLGI